MDTARAPAPMPKMPSAARRGHESAEAAAARISHVIEKERRFFLESNDMFIQSMPF
jgi:hypothetical protein